VLDPEKRLSASEALNHKYFHTNPLSASPEDLPKYESSHEYNCRKEKDRRKHHRSHGKNDNNHIRDKDRIHDKNHVRNNERAHEDNRDHSRNSLSYRKISEDDLRKHREIRPIHPLPERPRSRSPETAQRKRR
jgi:hypothetical protein